ncbi:sulfur carrier protein [Thermomonospora echinospora]|uniref:Sulfur carrier protein n=1 Tax=Thermomonospora echinospora TaxID=1992 RepID=A0A1H5SAR6_9ACTN|nr:sulfur carrier protein ThiS [Thermomonospora echinospora]SEF47585.1 sulfur carrier protein [Thermomonospora echinospora]
MRVTVNGQSRELPEGTTVAAVVATVTEATTGVAVAINDEVVSRGSWAGTAVRDQDRVEVLTAVQGG